MGIIKEQLFVERQGWQKQRYNRNAACVDNTCKQDEAAHAAKAHTGCVDKVKLHEN